VTDADPAKNLDPALIAMMPQPTTTTTPVSQADEATQASSDLINTPSMPVENAVSLAETPALQASSQTIEEAYGPWRAEIYGPVLNAQRELLTQPVHVPVFEAPEPVAIQAPVSEVLAQLEIAPPRPNEMPVANHDAIADMSIRVVTIQVSVKAKAPSDAHELDATAINLSTTDSEQTDIATADQMQPTPVITAAPDFIGPQMIPLIVSDSQSMTPAQIDHETVADALNTPGPVQPDAHVLLFKAAQAMVANLQNSKPSPAPVFAQQTAVTPGLSTEAPAFDVSAVVEALHRDADLSRVAHRQADDIRNYASLLDTKITDPVAKTSSRSNDDIRNLMKLGVRDIEIVQGHGSAQDVNVTPQVQTTELTGASAATRAQLATSFAPTGNEANTAERRAQAHEIRMRAIERQVVAAVRDGADTIRMQLYPPGLGQIIIRLTMDGSKLKLTTSANSSDAADSLRSIEGDLRDALSVGGLELTGFDVSEDGDGGQKNRKNASEAEDRNQQSRSVRSDDFALDMNA
jgi:flagellar hook-length control protein FliK